MLPFKYRPLGRILVLLGVLLAGAVSLAQPAPAAATHALTCSGQFRIEHSLPNGALWGMCWEDRALDGITFYEVYFDPPGTAADQGERQILYSASLSQLHVPYDDNGARFHDVTDYGMGNNRQFLTAAECPGGTLIPLDTDAATNDFRICRTQTQESYAFKYGASQKQAYALTLFSVSAIGQYNYIPRWKFYDDGTIEIGIGATGRLQRYTSNASYGWLINGNSMPRGTSHTHNYWWRLDFALEGDANDRLEQVTINGTGTAQRAMNVTSYSSEAALPVAQTGFRWWRIRDTAITNSDGHPISYELQPNATQVFRGPSYEPWTTSDLYLTLYNRCERYASHNAAAMGCGADHVRAFVNSTPESVSDAVVYYGHSFHHVARDEDEAHMSSHWDSFKLVPRDMTATNPR